MRVAYSRVAARGPRQRLKLALLSRWKLMAYDPGVPMMDKLTEMQETATPFCKLLGIKFLSAAPDRVSAEMVVRPEMCTEPAILHGGAMMSFADALGANATVLNLPQGAWTTTIESKTNFLAPAPVGSRVIGECSAIHRGKRTMVWQTRISNEQGRLLAVVTQTQMVLENRG